MTSARPSIWAKHDAIRHHSHNTAIIGVPPSHCLRAGSKSSPMTSARRHLRGERHRVITASSAPRLPAVSAGGRCAGDGRFTVVTLVISAVSPAGGDVTAVSLPLPGGRWGAGNPSPAATAVLASSPTEGAPSGDTQLCSVPLMMVVALLTMLTALFELVRLLTPMAFTGFASVTVALDIRNRCRLKFALLVTGCVSICVDEAGWYHGRSICARCGSYDARMLIVVADTPWWLIGSLLDWDKGIRSP